MHLDARRINMSTKRSQSTSDLVTASTGVSDTLKFKVYRYLSTMINDNDNEDEDDLGGLPKQTVGTLKAADGGITIPASVPGFHFAKASAYKLSRSTPDIRSSNNKETKATDELKQKKPIKSKQRRFRSRQQNEKVGRNHGNQTLESTKSLGTGSRYYRGRDAFFKLDRPRSAPDVRDPESYHGNRLWRKPPAFWHSDTDRSTSSLEKNKTFFFSEELLYHETEKADDKKREEDTPPGEVASKICTEPEKNEQPKHTENKNTPDSSQQKYDHPGAGHVTVVTITPKHTGKPDQPSVKIEYRDHSRPQKITGLSQKTENIKKSNEFKPKSSEDNSRNVRLRRGERVSDSSKSEFIRKHPKKTDAVIQQPRENLRTEEKNKRQQISREELEAWTSRRRRKRPDNANVAGSPPSQTSVSSSALRRRRMEGREYRVVYLGNSTLTHFSTGLGAVQKALREVYIQYRMATGKASSQERTVKVNTEGISVLFNDGPKAREIRYPFSSIPFSAAVRYILRKDKTGKKLEGCFGPVAPSSYVTIDRLMTAVDKKHNFLAQLHHPPMVVCVMRRNKGLRALECHAFLCSNEDDARNLAFDLQPDSESVRDTRFADYPPPVSNEENYGPTHNVNRHHSAGSHHHAAVTAGDQRMLYAPEVRHSISTARPQHHLLSGHQQQQQGMPEESHLRRLNSQQQQSPLQSINTKFSHHHQRNDPASLLDNTGNWQDSLSDINLDDFTLQKHKRSTAPTRSAGHSGAGLDTRKEDIRTAISHSLEHQLQHHQRQQQQPYTRGKNSSKTHSERISSDTTDYHPPRKSSAERTKSEPSKANKDNNNTSTSNVGQFGFFFRGVSASMGQSTSKEQSTPAQQQQSHVLPRKSKAERIYQDHPPGRSQNEVSSNHGQSSAGRGGINRPLSPRDFKARRPTSPIPLSPEHSKNRNSSDGSHSNKKLLNKKPDRPVAKVPPHLRQGVRVLPSEPSSGIDDLKKSGNSESFSFNGKFISSDRRPSSRSGDIKGMHENNWKFGQSNNRHNGTGSNEKTPHRHVLESQDSSMSDKLLLSQKKDAEIASALSNLHFEYEPATPMATSGDFERSLGYLP